MSFMDFFKFGKKKKAKKAVVSVKSQKTVMPKRRTSLMDDDFDLFEDEDFGDIVLDSVVRSAVMNDTFGEPAHEVAARNEVNREYTPVFVPEREHSAEVSSHRETYTPRETYSAPVETESYSSRSSSNDSFSSSNETYGGGSSSSDSGGGD